MEEQVGAFWHRWITRTASRRHPEAAVSLASVHKAVGILFRALGGDGGLQVEASYATDHYGERTLMQKIAGIDKRVHNAWRDERSLLLPPQIDLFPSTTLNRDLYLWLAMLASTPLQSKVRHWVEQNRQNTLATLDRFPGFLERYQVLAAATTALRPPLEKLEEEQRAIEQRVQEAILTPQQAAPYPEEWPGPDAPVPLWLILPPGTGEQITPGDSSDPAEQQEPEHHPPLQQEREKKRRKGERSEEPDGKSGLLAIRMETIFSLAEYVKVDRTTDDEEDENAISRADDLDQLTITQNGESSKSRVKFDLDLPAAEFDDQPLGEGVLYPEWNYKHHQLVANQCRILPMIAADAQPCPLPEKLRRPARLIQRQFEALIPNRSWFRGEMDGNEVDLDAFLAFRADRLSGHPGLEPALYRDFRSSSRDLVTLLLADLSLSTDSWINNDARVIDVIRESIHLFAEALSHTGDRFALHGFSSRNRDHVRFNHIKGFDEHFNDQVRGRIEAVKPGYYTRMGTAIRHATHLLNRQSASRRVLLLLTDGKPNDLDKYEGRYGIEDTREAIHDARQQGLYPFCITIDQEGADYLPHIFGPSGYIVIRKPDELPLRLPRLYVALTANSG